MPFSFCRYRLAATSQVAELLSFSRTTSNTCEKRGTAATAAGAAAAPGTAVRTAAAATSSTAAAVAARRNFISPTDNQPPGEKRAKETLRERDAGPGFGRFQGRAE